MRLYLLPVSSRRTLLYAQRLHVTTNPEGTSSYVEKGVGYAARMWAKWEKEKSGWKRKVVDYGNTAFRRIPYEEWGLKSVPPLSTRRKSEELKGSEKVELVYPKDVIPTTKAETALRTLVTEREGLHRQRLIWCVVGMPFTAPFALVPIIPNLPFFYLVYRAWSHWRAITGGRHVQWLINNKLIMPSPSEVLDRLYRNGGTKPAEPQDKEQMLLTKDRVQSFSQTLDIPALEIELERAVWQVENALKQAEAQTQAAAKSAPEAEEKTPESSVSSRVEKTQDKK